MNYPLEIFTRCKSIVETVNKYNLSKALQLHYDEIMQVTHSFPESISLSQRGRAIALNLSCVCKTCGAIHGNPDKDFCSHACYLIEKKANVMDKPAVARAKQLAAIQASCDKFANGVDGVDYVECKICGFRATDLNGHVRIHDITCADYKSQYGELKAVVSKKFGADNPAHAHGGKYSKWSKNYVHGYDAHTHDEFKQTHSRFQKANDCNVFRRVAHASDEMYRLSQTRDLSYFIAKYGDHSGRQRHSEKTRKWLDSFPRMNYSMISQKLFDEITQTYSGNVHYATYSVNPDDSRQNKEYRLKCNDGRWVSLDFVDVDKKRVIEFDGDYWHGAARGNQEADKQRDCRIYDMGFTVMHVLEREYKQNPEQVVEQCLNFLTA